MIDRLREWFYQNKRSLPWRYTPTPYGVWVSEVMLQQTRVDVVIPYFQRWMARYPTVQHVADAPLDEVVKMWEGLGYYSRARNLHAGAQQVVEQFGGKLPSNKEELRTIRGLGDYTVGAILSFAFHQRAAAVDGNVLRVMSRLLGIEADISASTTKRWLKEEVQRLLPRERPWEISEAFIELGALVCKKTPQCHKCPLSPDCNAYATNRQDSIPVKTKKIQAEKLFRGVAVIHAEDSVLLRRAKRGEVMADLYEFPYVNLEESELSATSLAKQFTNSLGLEIKPLRALDPVNSTFTRFRVRHFPWVFTSEHRLPVPNYLWIALRDLDSLPFSSGHRRILRQLEFTQL